MQVNSMQQARARESLKNAAIYGVLADASVNPDRRNDYRRLREIEIASARKWATGSDHVSQLSAGRFSVSLALLKLVSRLVSATWVSGFMRQRFRRILSLNSEQYLQNDLRSEAVESMEILDRLSFDDSKHAEQVSLATRTGALRAAILGVNDGLVSNVALVLGVAGGTNDPNIVLLTGIVALVSGALSMAAGEYVSVVSQREFNESLVRWERMELLLWHEEEEQELVEILQSKGLESGEAKSVASRIMRDPEIALDVHVREELGLDPDDLGGSPVLAAISSLGAFAIGALVPLLPYIIKLNGSVAIVISPIVSGLAIAVIGGALGWLSGKGTVYGALRMLLVGLIAGAVTFGLGSLVGKQIG